MLATVAAAVLTAPAAAEPSAPPDTPASSGAQRTPAAAGYRLELRSNTAGDRWRGTQHVRFTNTAGTALDRVWLRLWGNGVHGCTDALPVRVSSVEGGTPGPLAVPATGSVVGTETAGGRTRTTVHAPRVRDFAFAAGPFRAVRTVTQAGVPVRGWITPDVSLQRAEAVAATVRSAVETFSYRYGAYPYAELDAVISGHFAESGGMEYPGFLLTEPAGSVAAHETAHQWWYGLVGNDQYRHPWLDESVTQFATDGFLGRSRHCDPYAWPSATARVDAGMDYFAAHYGEYVPTVYGQGPCMLHDLQNTVGAATMQLALRAVLEQNRYGVVKPAEFRRVMQHHSPVDLDPLWRRWRNVRG